MRRAWILGHKGQDGTCLRENLSRRGYEVVGIGREDADIGDEGRMLTLFDEHPPDEIYHLAAVHHASQGERPEDHRLFQESFRVNVFSLNHCLEGIRQKRPFARLFYAASSHVFGEPAVPVQDETTPLNPLCVYGITKAAGMQMCRFYRRQHGVFASVGVLYNHESPLRRPHFVSRKITEAAVAIKHGERDRLVLGDLDAAIDWGYAPDYVEAMRRMLEISEAGDFVVASGELHTVKDFVSAAFSRLGLDWQRYVEEDPSLITKKRAGVLCGNSEKLRGATGWRPEVDFSKMVAILVDTEEQRWESRQKGRSAFVRSPN